MKWFRRLPALVQGLLVLLAITAVGIFPPSILDEFAVRVTPRLPWVAPIALAWMWLVWRYLDQPGWRREHLGAKCLTSRQWLLALAALAAGTGAMHAFRMALLHWLRAPDVSLPNLPQLSASVLLSSFLVTALSAALFEEAGYRGYFQHMLEERYGWKTAIPLSAFIFTLAHISRGRVFFVVLPLVFLFGCLYGMVAWKTGSILPGVVVHFTYNLVRLLERWLSPRIGLGTKMLGALGLALAGATWIIFRGLPKGNAAVDAVRTLKEADSYETLSRPAGWP